MIQSRSALAMTAVGSASGSPWASRNEQRTNRRLPTRIAGCSVLRSSPISQHCSRRDRARIGYRCFVPPVLRPGRSTAWTRSVRIRFFSSADYFIVLKMVSGGFPKWGSEFVSTEPRQSPAAGRRCWANTARKFCARSWVMMTPSSKSCGGKISSEGGVRLAFETIVYEEDGPIGTITINRPDDGNMFTPVMCHEIRDCIEGVRRETRTRVLVLTGAGDRFFCIGGRKDGMEKTILYAGTLPTLEICERAPFALASVKAAFNARHGGVSGLARLSHDLLLRSYLESDESYELSASFAERRKPDPSKFGS